MKKRFRYEAIAALSLLCLCLSFQGCVRDQAEMEKSILKHDPSFKKDIDKRNALLKQLDLQKADFIKKKEDIRVQMDALKEKKVRSGQEYAAKAEQIKRQLHPEQRNLKRDLIEMQRCYGQKSEEVRHTERDIREINVLIKKKDKLALTQAEIQTWNDRLASLVKKWEMLSSEREKLRTEIGVTKMKIKVLNHIR